jgi:UDP-N-acetyl-D-mannosaminouronate:lipid I N-acetyl-D-mannosaminouronosyltransferase
MTDNRISLKGVLVYPFKSVDELIEKELEEKKVLVAINAEKVVLSTNQTRGIISRNIGYCDGEGPIKVIKKKGYKDVIRIAGCDLWLQIIDKLSPQGKSFYFIGSKQEVIEETIEKLKKQFPNLNIAGFRNGFIKDNNERNALIHEIATKKPDVVFVAMGSPKQEILMEDMHALHPAVYQGLGGSFDVYTGHVKRAPKWLQSIKMEWAYRFYAKPSRIGRLKNYINFFVQMELGKL